MLPRLLGIDGTRLHHVLGTFGAQRQATTAPENQMVVSENVVYPFFPNGFADHYPVFKWLQLGIYPIFRQTQMLMMVVVVLLMMMVVVVRPTLHVKSHARMLLLVGEGQRLRKKIACRPESSMHKVNLNKSTKSRFVRPLCPKRIEFFVQKD